MDEEYDCIVLGTGLKECILSGLLSVDGKKVLHMDRNDYYGGASASLNLNQLYQQYKGGASANAALGASREYNVDIVPKFIMAGGILVKMLIHTDVTKYLEFKVVEGSYVQKNGKINKVPATEKEALQTNLMGLLEKRRFKKMLEFISQWEAGNPKTHKGISPASTMREVFQKFDLDAGTVDFTGHALALYLEDSYLDRACPETFDRIKLYFESLARYQKSPYIYPLYGLGELPQAFARLSAIYGGTYMLSKPIDEVLYDSSGKFTGVRSGEEVVKARFVVGDPSYFPGKVHTTGKVVRIVCIMDHGIPGIKDSESVQIIIPQNQVNRNHDIYITLVSFAHMVAPKGKYIAMVSTTVETANPEAECQPGIDLLGPILERFVMVTDSQEPNGDGSADQVFISRSFDATSHFETTCLDVMEIYRRITGKELDLSAKESHEEGEGSTSK